MEEQVVVSKRRPWGKYAKRAALALLLLAVALRAILPLALPSILDRVAAGQGLRVEYSKLDLSVFGGSLELWNVSVRPTGEGQSAQASRLGLLEFLTVDLDVSALLGGTLRAHRVEIDGLDVYARRDSLETGWTWQALLGGRPDSESMADRSEEVAPEIPEEKDPSAAADP
ncbi:MAG: hypothetical protein KDB61_07370, partial [Planctomycetes bacterium]|nr:hypothetical protein [Planctomycetota bacterium]